MNKREFTDLAHHAKQRHRDRVMLTLQLLETDEECAALLVVLAMDCLNGAAAHLLDEESGINEQRAMAKGVAMLMQGLGVKVMEASLTELKRAREQS